MSEYNLKQNVAQPQRHHPRDTRRHGVPRAHSGQGHIARTCATGQSPITIARHAYGDIYRAKEMLIPGPGKCELVFTGADGEKKTVDVFDFKGSGVALGMHNLDASIESFARACFRYALDVKQDLWFSTKDTISKTYDGRFKEIFQNIFDAEFKPAFDAAGIEYFYTLIDDAVARVIRSKGGFIWAYKELRWRRDERHAGHGVRLAGDDDLGAGIAQRPVRIRGRTRHRHAPLLPLFEGRKDLHQPGGDDIRVDRAHCASAASWTTCPNCRRLPTSWSTPRCPRSRAA